MRRLLFLIALIAMPMFWSPASAASRFIVVLVDQSASMVAYRGQQIGDLEKLIGSLRGGDVVRIYGIDANPLGQPDPATIRLDPYDPGRFNELTYQLYIQEKITRAKEGIRQGTMRIFNQNPSLDTAIIDSLELAAREFRSPAAHAFSDRKLILLSDMWEDQPERIRLPGQKLSSAQISKLLRQIGDEKRIPNLSGVEVWVAGARIHLNSPREFEDQLQLFWLKFFALAGAKTCAENFAPSLRYW